MTIPKPEIREPSAKGTQPLLSVKGVAKHYGEGAKRAQILQGVEFDVAPGEFVCVVGPSGAGKTTLLKVIAGLIPASDGSVVLEGETVDGPPKQLAVVFQDYSRSLLPWLTVAQNVALPLKNKMRKEAIGGIVEQTLKSVGLAGKGSLYPWQMSGGMQQRAAIARGLAYQPDVLLMDEPFAAVDAQTRMDMEDLMLEVAREYKMTVLFVTHDIDEAVYLADRVVVLSGAPAKVREEIVVDLPSPRHQIDTKLIPLYAQKRAHVFELIQESKRSNTPRA